MKIDPANLDWLQTHDLLIGAIVPRPIALISTIGVDGIFNVAPFSFFAGVASKPMIVGFSTSWKRDGQRKDTLINIEFSRDFVVNVVDEALAEAMNKASDYYPSHVDEFKEAGLTPVKADIVKSPMVGESPINMECRFLQVLEFGDFPRISTFVLGKVVRVHIKDELYVNNEIQMSGLKAIARMGGELYCRTRDIFEMKRPDFLD